MEVFDMHGTFHFEDIFATMLSGGVIWLVKSMIFKADH